MKTIKISSYAQYIAASKFFIEEIKQSTVLLPTKTFLTNEYWFQTKLKNTHTKTNNKQKTTTQDKGVASQFVRNAGF